MSDGLNTYQGINTTLNITQPMTVKPAGGRIVRVQVLVAGTVLGGVYDAQSTAGVTVNGVTTANGVANQVGVIPNTVGPVMLDMRCTYGITIAPGTGQTLAVSYD